MRRLGRFLLDALILLALVWTIVEEGRHLRGRVPAGAVAVALIDVAVTVVLIVYAGYEVLYLAGATGRFDGHLRAHRWFRGGSLVLAACLGWGISRDVVHFHHEFLGAAGNLPFGDELDEVAAAVLGLGILKLAYHAASAFRLLRGRSRRRRRGGS